MLVDPLDGLERELSDHARGLWLPFRRGRGGEERGRGTRVDLNDLLGIPERVDGDMAERTLDGHCRGRAQRGRGWGGCGRQIDKESEFHVRAI